MTPARLCAPGEVLIDDGWTLGGDGGEGNGERRPRSAGLPLDEHGRERTDERYAGYADDLVYRRHLGGCAGLC
ncbi:MAG: hypothetical protein ACOXZM_08860 [Eubacteriales bacterium]